MTATATATASPSASGNYANARHKTSTAGPIAGGVGAFLIVALISFFVYLDLRRRRTKWSNEREGEGYIPPSMRESRRISPFVQPASSTVHNSGRLQKYAPVSANSMSRLPETLSKTQPPIVHSIESAYVTLGTSSNQTLSASNSAPSHPDVNYRGQSRRPLRSMTTGNRLSPIEEMTFPSLQSLNNIEVIISGAEGGTVGEEMSMSDMREQLMLMRAQIAYLQDQQRSTWVQGLSDNPPPGYTPVRTSARYLAPTPTVALSES